MINREHFAIVMTGLAETFGSELGDAALELYYAALEDIGDVAFQRAATRAVKELRFMPRPAELRELAGESTTTDRAIAAWTEAKRALAIGTYASVDFEDVAINAAIRSLGGWVRFCAMTDDEADRFGRRDFLQAYSAFAKMPAIAAEHAAHLPGIEERENGGRGLPIAPPRRIAASTKLLRSPRVMERRDALVSGAPALALMLGSGGDR